MLHDINTVSQLIHACVLLMDKKALGTVAQAQRLVLQHKKLDFSEVMPRPVS